ncbi:hypothetical protein [Bacillus sp. NMCN1]|uniref:hypothetical protein n=1 Tax=Bacillus sp. NMCN1 TaxID=2108536 RepID=UPI000D03D08F|nr:hypothetical protein [Bacillus sp. NMCN1]PRR92875.1 hypothetical protein C6W21_05645 [Bacillus sp. NMCN1]
MGAIIIKIEILKPGVIFKNHKDFCERMGLAFKNSTNSRKAQLKELARYCIFEKQGHSIIIKKCFVTPVPKAKLANNSVYNELIEWLVLDILSQEHNNGRIYITKSKLISSLGFVNQNYFKHMHDKKKIALLVGVDSDSVQDFYNTSQSSFKKAIETALKGLTDRSMISCTSVFKVKENGQESRLATTEEREAILACQKKIMKKLGFTKLSQIVTRGKKVWRDFETQVNKELYLYNNINSYFQVYEIILNRKYMEEECISMLGLQLKKAEQGKYTQEINVKACAKLLHNAKKRHINSSENLYRKQSNYTEDISALIDILIRHNADSISDDLKSLSTLDEKTNKEIANIFS